MDKNPFAINFGKVPLQYISRDIVIDEKYKGLTEKDFNPNVLYDPELISYIELMVKRMDNDSYDKMFRECVGYLNMIIRNYLPDKKKVKIQACRDL